MRTKLDAIKWALAHLDEVVYFAGTGYRVVGVGRGVFGWTALCRVKKGWTELYFDDCILSDLTEGDNNQFSYLPIDEIEDLWYRLKV